MKAIGDACKLYVDLFAQVRPGDVIQTGTGRRYGVLVVRVQQRGKHRGRQHLQVVVIESDATPAVDGSIHLIRWYPRGK